MKKSIINKLNLTKETISNLNVSDMNQVKGGYATASCPDMGCNTTLDDRCTLGCPSINWRYCSAHDC